MGINDSFIDNVTCTSCGEDLLMRLQIKIDGMRGHDYAPGKSISNGVLQTIQENESEFVQSLGEDLDASPEDLAEIDLESKDGTFAVVGDTQRIGRKCSCRKAPDRIMRLAVVERGVFQGFSKGLPKRGPIVLDRGSVFPRWTLQEPNLRPLILYALKDLLGVM